jgi:flagella basal body P-ring formation protein FlgA
MLAAVAATSAAQPASGDVGRQEAVRQAIERAVLARLGSEATVHIDDLRVSGQTPAESSQVLAVPDHTVRTGRPSRFLLKWAGRNGRSRRYGEARATLRVELPHFRVRRPVERGQVLQPDDVERVEHEEADGVALGRLPDRVVGMRAARDLAEGTVVTQAELRSTALVRSGDVVVTVVKVDGLIVRGTAVAAQQGRLGQTIRVVNPASGRALKAKVVGPGEVEVTHGA